MGSGGFPINEMRWQLSTMERGEHIVLKLAGKDIWAVGWHDHHYKCYITTHGMTLPPSLPTTLKVRRALFIGFFQ